MLTLIPESWSIMYASKYFSVSEYLVRKARELKKEKGILSLPAQKIGKILSAETSERVKAFFQDDEYSRLLPGKKDVVSIGKNVYQQKRLLLCNLKELYAMFKEKYPMDKIGLSKFCSLRPKWCVTVGSTGTHSVCVCSIHQNTILLVDAANTGKTYKELMEMVVCSRENNECMVHRCYKCPGTTPLRAYLQDALASDQQEIPFKQWQSTDRSELVNQILAVDEFIDLLVNSIDKLTSHSYIAKCQAKYFADCKGNLPENSLVVVGDFAENYTFVVQDEIQSFHWSKSSCTLHPIVLYFKQDGKLIHQSYCFISDDLEHDTNFVYELQCELMKIIKAKLPHIERVEYFSDGCAAQYKNYKNMVNLCLHKKDLVLTQNMGLFCNKPWETCL